MSLGLIILVTFGLLILLFLSNQPVAFAMLVTGLAGLIWFMEGKGLSAVGSMMFNTANSFELTAIPLFIFMGDVLLQIGLSERLYRGLTPILGRFPGGLLHSNIVACAIFSAISGSSSAVTATVGKVAIPEMEKRGYDLKMTVGSVAGGGTLGILIPPSIIMIIYGALVGESVGRLFIAGVIPGVLMTGLFMTYIAVRVRLQPGLTPQEHIRTSWRDLLEGTYAMGPVLFLILAVLGSIYLGVATPTEAAALGAAGALLLGLVYRKLGRQMLIECALSSVKLTSMLLLLIVGAKVMSYVLANLEVPRQMAAWVAAAAIGPMPFIIGVCILFLILGCFMQGITMMVLTFPVLLPIVKTLNIELVWLGIIVVILSEIALETPPVGLNLFIMQGIAPKASFKDIVVGTFPYVIVGSIVLIMIIVFPEVATWLPSTMMGKR